MLSKLDGDIHPMSMRDYFRIGRFKERSPYPRSILVKLTHSMEVHYILSQQSNLPEGVIINQTCLWMSEILNHFCLRNDIT